MASTTTDAPFVFSAGMAFPGADGGATPLGSGAVPGSGIPGTAASAADDLVRQTRREIAEIVREVATLARQNLDRTQFFSALVDRTVRALAAEGAVIWDLAGLQPTAVVRTGRITDAQITGAGRLAHDRMLAEIVGSGTPVVVPPTPIADDTEAAATAETDHSESLPANPTERPAAVVPILDPLEIAPSPNAAGQADAGCRYVLEVFIEPDAGIATQRGYLRFTAQMADLAGDFLRLDEIRRAREAAQSNARLDHILPRLHRHDTLEACAAEIVDSAVELFQCARATLVRVGSQTPTGPSPHAAARRGASIVAISHVETIDHRGAACQRLLDQVCSHKLSPDWAVWTPDPEQMPFGPPPAKDPAPIAVQGASAMQPAATAAIDAPLFPIAVIALGDSGQYRLYLQSTWPAPWDAAQRRMAQRFASGAAAALRTAVRLQSIPLARVWLACLPAESHAGTGIDLRWRLRSLALPIAALLVIALFAVLPCTMSVTLSATLRPEGVRTHYAPCDALVHEVLVRHGEQVAAGQPMLILRDVTLEEQTATQMARRAVVGEKLSRVLASLVEAPQSSASLRVDGAPSTDEALVAQQRLLEEELRGIDQQLQLLADARERLVLRSDRDGVVDAWQTEQTALGRPVRTGQPLMRVQPLQPRWVADARVPQNRSELVFAALSGEQQPAIEIRLEGADRNAVRGRYVRHSGFEPEGGVGQRAALVEFELLPFEDSAAGTDGVTAQRWQNGAPIEVAVDCGKLPLAHVLFFDFIRSIRLQWARWS